MSDSSKAADKTEAKSGTESGPGSAAAEDSSAPGSAPASASASASDTPTHAPASSSTAPSTDNSNADPSTDAGAEDDDDVVCCVCFNGDVEEENQIVFCEGTGPDGEPCTAIVHQCCYGVTKIPEGDEPWYCDMCKVKKGLKKVSAQLRKTVDRCVLCPHTSGAFKPLHDGSGWCHASCAVWVPETGFADPAKMESIIGVDAVDRLRWTLKCEICNARGGACIQCMAHACRYSFHTICGGTHKESVKMDMEAVSVGSTFDVLKLVYCDRHRYLADDPLEKQILIRKWRSAPSPGEEEEEEDEAEGEGEERKTTPRRRLVRMGRKRGRRKRKDSDDESSETSESSDDDMESGMVSDNESVVASSIPSSSSSSEEFEEDDEGNVVRKKRIYMCTECGSMKPRHRCIDGMLKSPARKPRKAKRTGGDGRQRKRPRIGSGIRLPGPHIEPIPIVNPYPHLFFPSYSSLNRQHLRDDETDSDIASVDIPSDALLDEMSARFLRQEEEAEKRWQRQYEERRIAMGEDVRPPKLSLTPTTPRRLKKERSASSRRTSSSSTSRIHPSTRQPTFQSKFQHLDVAQLTPQQIQALMLAAKVEFDRQIQAQSQQAANNAQSNDSVKSESVPAAATTANDTTIDDLSLKPLVQPQSIQEMMALAKLQQPVSPPPASNNGLASVPSFLTSPDQYHALLKSYVAQQQLLEQKQMQQHLAATIAAQRSEVERKRRMKEEQRAKIKQEKQTERERAKMERQARKIAAVAAGQISQRKGAAAAMKARAMGQVPTIHHPVIPAAQARRIDAIKKPISINSIIRPRPSLAVPASQLLLTPAEENMLKQNLLRLLSAQSARDRLAQLSQLLLEPSQESMRALGLRFMTDYRGLDVLRAWMETALVIVAGAKTMERKAAMQNRANIHAATPAQTRSATASTTALSAAASTPTTTSPSVTSTSKAGASTDTSNSTTPSQSSSAAASSSSSLSSTSSSTSASSSPAVNGTSSNSVGSSTSSMAGLLSTSTTPATAPSTPAASSTPPASTASAPATTASSTITTTPSSMASSSAPSSTAVASSSSSTVPAATPVVTPSMMNRDLIVVCLRVIDRMTELTDLPRLTGYAQCYAALVKLSSNEHAAIKHWAMKLRSKLPNPGIVTSAPIRAAGGAAAAGVARTTPKVHSIATAGRPMGIAQPQRMQPAMTGQMAMQQQQQQRPGMATGAIGQPTPGPGQGRAPYPPYMQQRQQTPTYTAGWQTRQIIPPHHHHQQQQQQAQYMQQPRQAPLPPAQMYQQRMAQQQQQQRLAMTHQQHQQPYHSGPPHTMQQQRPSEQDDYFSATFNDHPDQQMQQQQQQQYREHIASPYPTYAQTTQAPVSAPSPSYSQPTPHTAAPSSAMNALSALTAMLGSSASSTQPAASMPVQSSAVASPSSSSSTSSPVNVSQLSQWLQKFDGSGSGPAAQPSPTPVSVSAAVPATAPSAATTPGALAALLSKVQGLPQPSPQSHPQQSQPSLTQPTASVAMAPPNLSSLQKQLSDVQSSVRFWDDQYRQLWEDHHRTTTSISAIQALNVIDKLQRMPELQQLEARATQLAAQLTQVQRHQREAANRLQDLQHQIAMEQQRMGQPQQQHHQQQQQQQQPPPQQQTQADPRMVLVSGLSPSSVETSVRAYFSSLIGSSLLHCQLYFHPSGQSAGYAYVAFQTPEQARHVCNLAAQGRIALDGSVLSVSPAGAAA